MITSPSLRAIRPGPQRSALHQKRLDEAVHLMRVHGEVSHFDAAGIARAIDTALADEVRWIVLDLSEAPRVSGGLLGALIQCTRELRARRGELILTGTPAGLAEGLEAFEAAHRPALAADAGQAMAILKLLRPKTFQRPKPSRRRLSTVGLARIEPHGTG